MQVLVIRHAPAEDLSDLHQSDFDRELTSKGRKLFREFVGRVVKPDRLPSLVLYSPLVRTRQTAEIFQEVTGVEKSIVRVEPALQPGLTVSRLVQLLENRDEECIAVIGHNPDVSICTSQLIGGGSLEFKKGSIASIEFFDGVRLGLGRLNWFVAPKLIVEH